MSSTSPLCPRDKAGDFTANSMGTTVSTDTAPEFPKLPYMGLKPDGTIGVCLASVNGMNGEPEPKHPDWDMERDSGDHRGNAGLSLYGIEP